MKPNIVFIMTDNQGAWTLGCQGNREIRTPNIDRLAAEGIRFSRAYCVNSVCSPNRATVMTGLIPSQHGVHSWLGGEKPDAQMGPDAYDTIQEFRSLPNILSDHGYTCGLSGKWHLGDSLHPQEDFTYWFTKPRGHTSRFYDDELIWQEEVYEEPRYTTEVITEHAVEFLHQSHEKPFFLWVGYNGPYGLGESMTDVHRNRHTDYYADKPLDCFPREEVHPWLVHNQQIINNPVSIRGYAAAVSGVDDGVGTIMNTLKELGLEENTLVVYTADQGLCGGHHGMWGMGDHSRPIHTFEETVHIPQIIRHPAGIPAGQVFDQLTCNYDVFPSLLDYLGLGDEIPETPLQPGANFAPALRGKDVTLPDAIFHDYENTRMVRTDDWKYTRRHPDGPDELYDLRSDPGERENLVDRPEHASVVQEFRTRLDDFFSRHADPKFDIWRGGRSKAGRLIR